MDVSLPRIVDEPRAGGCRAALALFIFAGAGRTSRVWAPRSVGLPGLASPDAEKRPKTGNRDMQTRIVARQPRSEWSSMGNM